MLQESLEIKVLLEILDLLGRQVHQVTGEFKVREVLPVHQVLLGSVALKVCKVLKGFQGSKELQGM